MPDAVLRERRETFLSAAVAVRDLVTRIPEGAFGGPGLGEWDLKSLVGHTSRSLLTVVEYLRRPADHIDIDSAAGYVIAAKAMTAAAPADVAQRGRDAGAALGDRPAARFAELCAAVAIDLGGAEDGDEDRVITCIAGGIRLRDYLATRTFELAVHGIDIADATGLPFEPPAEVYESALGTGAGAASRLGLAPPLLRAITGRAPLPAGFCVV
jgi:uncharacterized protein (TIGR03083 family)